MFYQLPYSPLPQYIILVIFSLMLHYSKDVNAFIDKFIMDDKNQHSNFVYIKYFIMAIPLILILIFDTLFHSFSMNNLKITTIIPNEHLNYSLRILGIYGVVQVLSQDFGIKTGRQQSVFTKNEFVHFFIMFGAGFALSGQRSESFIAALIYVFLRNLISDNKTLDVCFE